MKFPLLYGGLSLAIFAAWVQGDSPMLAQERIAGASLETQRALVEEYCAKCYNDQLKSGGFSWTDLDIAHPEANAQQAEKVIRKLRAGMMPPSGQARPENAALDTFVRASKRESIRLRPP